MARLEKPNADYKFLDLDKPGSRQRVLDLVLPPGESSSGAPYGVLDILFGHSGLRTALVESEYIDVDHSRSYSRFYARSFLDHSKRTTRIHFFTRRLTRSDLPDLVRHQDEYLGYIVVRPLRIRTIGRTVLRPPRSPVTRYHFTTLNSGSRVNIAGNSLLADGCPFMEQDARVSACASASIWMATSPTVRRFALQSQSTADITDFATSIDVGARRIQSEGLRPDQMSEALRRMGYEPIQIAFTDRARAIATVYAYTESGIAPILLLKLTYGLHTAASVGHSYNPSISPGTPVSYEWTNGRTLQFWRSWQWVDEFIVNDDQRGPYRTLRFLSDAELQAYVTANYPGRTLAQLGADKWTCPIEINHLYGNAPGGHPAGFDQSTIADLLGVSVPSPSGVSLSAEEAEGKVARIIGIWADTKGFSLPNNLHLRTYLASANEFKAILADSPSLHPFARDLYLGKGLPHWLWVTEVGFVDEVVTDDPQQSRIRGEILIDANSSPWIPDFVTLHLPRLRRGAPTGTGLLSTMRHGDKNVPLSIAQAWTLDGDDPYERFTRSWA